MTSSYFQNSWAFLVIVGAFAFIIVEVLLRKKMNPSVLARVTWISLLGFILADLMFVSSTQWSQPEAIKIFVDRSDSVAELAERKGKVERFLKEIQEWSTDRKLPSHIYSFGDHLVEENKDLQWGALRTLLQTAEDIATHQEGVNLVLSDGLWTDYAHFRTSTFAVNMGSEGERDVWIEKVQPVFTAFLKNRLKIPYTLAHHAFEGKHAAVSLWRENEKIAEQEIVLDGKQISSEFTYFPERMGEQTFILKVQPLDGELSALNNEMPIKIRTVRDKIRILHVGGKPSLDLKAWRLFLTRQPDVDLVSFYILRSVNDDPEAKNSELSLIPFPYEELFSTELEKFDLVILQNFDFNLYFPPFYLSNLANFVRKGGALLMTGGDQSIHRYNGSPLESIFPFKFRGEGELEETKATVKKAASHPVIDGLESAFQVSKWSAKHRIADEPNSQTLLKYSSGEPMMAIREIDKGRVAVINSDELWRLQMEPTSEAPIFGKLARRLLQYLTFDPEVNPRGILSGNWKTGQEVTLELANHQKTNWRIRSLAFKPLEVSFKGEDKVKFKVPFPGVFEVSAEALSETRTFETEETPWRSEWKNLISDSSKLRQLVGESDGKVFDFEDRKKVFEQPLSGKQMISAQISSWSRRGVGLSWFFLLATIGLMCLDFFLRKKNHWDA